MSTTPDRINPTPSQERAGASLEQPVNEFDKTTLQEAVDQGLITTPNSPKALEAEKTESHWKKWAAIGTLSAFALGGIGFGAAKALGGSSSPERAPSASAPVTPGTTEPTATNTASAPASGETEGTVDGYTFKYLSADDIKAIQSKIEAAPLADTSDEATQESYEIATGSSYIDTSSPEKLAESVGEAMALEAVNITAMGANQEAMKPYLGVDENNIPKYSSSDAYVDYIRQKEGYALAGIVDKSPTPVTHPPFADTAWYRSSFQHLTTKYSLATKIESVNTSLNPDGSFDVTVKARETESDQQNDLNINAGTKLYTGSDGAEYDYNAPIDRVEVYTLKSVKEVNGAYKASDISAEITKTYSPLPIDK